MVSGTTKKKTLVGASRYELEIVKFVFFTRTSETTMNLSLIFQEPKNFAAQLNNRIEDASRDAPTSKYAEYWLTGLIMPADID